MSIRCDAMADDLFRSANLPSPSSFTACGWARIVTNVGAGTNQPLFWMFDTGLTDGIALFWNTALTTTGLELDIADGGSVIDLGATGSRPAVGEDFFWFVRGSGTGADQIEAGYRLSSQSTFTTTTATLGTTVAAPANINLNAVAGVYYADKRVWNVKLWDRALTQAELLWESFCQRVVFPTSINGHWWLRNTGDLADRSGNGRTISSAGTLASEDEYPLWVPRAHALPRRGRITLSIADATHAHSVESPSLTQANMLVTADALHSHVADAVALTQSHLLVISDALHGHTSEAPTLSESALLALADALHAHTADAVELTQARVLAIAEALHGHAADEITLSAEGTLAIADALHAHLAENPDLIQANVLVVAETSHGHTVEVIALQLPEAPGQAAHRLILVRRRGR